MIRVAIYARVSPLDQVPENQLAELRRAGRNRAGRCRSLGSVEIDGGAMDRCSTDRYLDDLRAIVRWWNPAPSAPVRGTIRCLPG